MGWASCGKDDRGRRIGYAYSGKCDHKGCNEKITRGLANVCGGMHGGDALGCGGYFCEKHLSYVAENETGRCVQVCAECHAHIDHEFFVD